MTRIRKSLRLEEWPAPDRLAFEHAFEFGSLFDSDGLAAHWAPDTRIGVIKAYGHWLAFLIRTGQLRETSSPAAQVTSKSLADYVHSLESHLAPFTVVTRVRGLAEALRVMKAKDAHHLVRCVHQNLRRKAKPSRDSRESLVAPSQLYWAGIDRMERHRSMSIKDTSAAIMFSDGLMMAMLAAKPVRRRNFFRTQIGVHLRKSSSGIYEWRFEAYETKTKERIFAALPLSLAPYLDFWIETVRPVLLGNRQSDALWLTTTESDMAIDTGYCRFCRATHEELGVRVNPHMVRSVVATGVAIEMPDSVGITPMLLDHRSDQTSRQYYNLADQLSASGRYLEELEKLRIRTGMSDAGRQHRSQKSKR